MGQLRDREARCRLTIYLARLERIFCQLLTDPTLVRSGYNISLTFQNLQRKPYVNYAFKFGLMLIMLITDGVPAWNTYNAWPTTRPTLPTSVVLHVIRRAKPWLFQVVVAMQPMAVMVSR